MTSQADLDAAYAYLDQMLGPVAQLDTSGPTTAELADQMDLDGKAQERAEALHRVDQDPDQFQSGENL